MSVRDGLEILAGWAYLALGFHTGVPMSERHAEGFDRFIAEALDGHPYRLYRDGPWLVVGVAPPGAEAAASRLRRALEQDLSGISDPDDDDLGDSLN